MLNETENKNLNKPTAHFINLIANYVNLLVFFERQSTQRLMVGQKTHKNTFPCRTTLIEYFN